MISNQKLSEFVMRDLVLLPSSINIAACSFCLPSRNTYSCPNNFLCRDCIGGSVSNVEGAVKALRQAIWKENGTPSQRFKCLVAKLRENMKTYDENGLPTINYFLNGVKVCKSYFKVCHDKYMYSFCLF
jgi:hypothetical protein